MAKDYPLIAKQTLQLVGGPDNVTHVMHCATRLRFTLKNIDTAVANKDVVKAIPGVIDVIVQNGQYQVCIGPDVSKVFAEVTKVLPQLQQGEAPADNQGQKKWSDRFFECKNRHPSPICTRFEHHLAGVLAPLSRTEATKPYNWFSTAKL